VKTGLSSRQSFTLYGIVLGFVFLFYVLGLLIGKNYFVARESSAEKPPISDGPLPDVKSQLDFYQQLIVPSPSAEEVPPFTPDKNPAASQKPTSQPTDTVEMYTIQVGALSREEDARQILIRLEAKNYVGRIQRPQGSNDPYYRVLVEEFSTLEKTRQMKARLKEDGFPTFIKKFELPDVPVRSETRQTNKRAP
jgi:cell division septation protein DedD